MTVKLTTPTKEALNYLLKLQNDESLKNGFKNDWTTDNLINVLIQEEYRRKVETQRSYENQEQIFIYDYCSECENYDNCFYQDGSCLTSL